MLCARSSTAVVWRRSPARHPPQNGTSAFADVYVRPDGDQLRLLAASLADGKLHVEVRASYPLARAAEALAQATRGAGGGAVVLEL
jgi:NADPH:quinone reductase-like Zn-dependent oxidoreductase